MNVIWAAFAEKVIDTMGGCHAVGDDYALRAGAMASEKVQDHVFEMFLNPLFKAAFVQREVNRLKNASPAVVRWPVAVGSAITSADDFHREFGFGCQSPQYRLWCGRKKQETRRAVLGRDRSDEQQRSHHRR